MRRGEALGLRWRDVDLETGEASIAQTVVVSHQQGLILQPPKTNGGRRVIDLDDDTVAVLRALQGQQLLHKVALEGAYQDRNLVFANPLGNPIYPDTLAKNFKKLAGSVGLEGLKLHDLRHFHASVLIQRGESPALVSKRLGHATVSITRSLAGKPLAGFRATPDRRIIVLCGIIVSVIRFKNPLLHRQSTLRKRRLGENLGFRPSF